MTLACEPAPNWYESPIQPRDACPPPRYAWADPAYELVHASIVPCHADILRALRGEGRAETDVSDNLRTLSLVFAAYESAERRQAVTVSPPAA